MKKILAFLKEYAPTIIGIIFVLLLVTAFSVPLIIAFASLVASAIM